jgi:Mrp family chromosome partitioning ATPase/capsular polysaccharide biosynthesis protein
MNHPEAALGIEPRDTARYLAAVREHWILVILVLVVAGGSAKVFAAHQKVNYLAQADLLVSPVDPGDQALTGLGLLRDPTGSVFTAGRLLQTPQVQDQVIRRLHLRTTRRGAATMVKITPIQQSNIVSISGHGSTAAKAAAIANAFALSLIEERTREFQARLKRELVRLAERRAALGHKPTAGSEAQIAGQLDTERAYLTSYVGETDPTLQLWSRAVPPDSAAPKSKTGLLVAFFAALLLATSLAMLLELVSGRMRREHELAGKIAVLARVPRLRFGAARRYLSGHRRLPARQWEAYRNLRARLRGSAEHGPRAIVVSSAVKGEGKTMTAVNLAIALAAGGTRVVLVDANVRNPGVGRAFRVEAPEKGLLALLNGIGQERTGSFRNSTDAPTAAEDLLIRAGDAYPRIRLLLPESEAAAAVDLLDRVRVEKLLEQLGGHGIVVVDSPALNEYGEAISLAGAADALLLCVRLGRSSREAFAEALQMVVRDELPLAGCVLTVRHRARRRGMRPIAVATTAEANAPTPAPV